jgi:NAD+ diphosphatase
MNGHNVFAGAFVDRNGHMRKDSTWIADAFSCEEACFAPVWHGRCLVDGEPPAISLLPHNRVDPFIAPPESVFLGMFRDRPCFAFPVAGDEAPFADCGQFHDLRYLGTVLPADEANLVAHAIALVNWHRVQRFCSNCGSAAVADPGGNTRSCSNQECGAAMFPRVDPAIIVLVASGDECLLGRQSSWPEDRFSTIAGFVEPGESLEDAVRREVHEETNIEVGSVRYHSSQPWPFPSSLMLGFTAVANSRDIHLNDGELEDARWFSRKQCRSGFPKLPFRLSIARRLVDDWLDDE